MECAVAHSTLSGAPQGVDLPQIDLSAFRLLMISSARAPGGEHLIRALLVKAHGGSFLFGQIEVSNRSILMTDKFVPSESHNESEIMSAPTSSGCRGMGDSAGPHSRKARAAPIL